MDEQEMRLEELLSHSDWVRRLAARLVDSMHEAEDLSQRTWLAALLHPPRHGGNLRSWLGKVLRRSAREWRESEDARNRRERSAVQDAEVVSAEKVAEAAELQRRVVGAVLALQAPYRDAILLRYFADQGPAQIAQAQLVPLETVRTRLKRGLALLREALDQDFGGPAEARSVLLVLSGGIHGAEIAAIAVPGVSITGVSIMGVSIMAASLTLVVIGGWWLVALTNPESLPMQEAVPVVSLGDEAPVGPSAPAFIWSETSAVLIVTRVLVPTQEAMQPQEKPPAVQEEPSPEQDLRGMLAEDLPLAQDTSPEFESAVRQLRAGELDLEAWLEYLEPALRNAWAIKESGNLIAYRTSKGELSFMILAEISSDASEHFLRLQIPSTWITDLFPRVATSDLKMRLEQQANAIRGVVELELAPIGTEDQQRKARELEGEGRFGRWARFEANSDTALIHDQPYPAEAAAGAIPAVERELSPRAEDLLESAQREFARLIRELRDQPPMDIGNLTTEELRERITAKNAHRFASTWMTGESFTRLEKGLLEGRPDTEGLLAFAVQAVESGWIIPGTYYSANDVAQGFLVFPDGDGKWVQSTIQLSRDEQGRVRSVRFLPWPTERRALEMLKALPHALGSQNRFEIVFEVWPGTPTELQIRVDLCCNLPDVQRAMQEKLEAGNLGDWCRVSVAEGCALTGQFGYQTSREDSVLTHAPVLDESARQLPVRLAEQLIRLLEPPHTK